MVRFVRCFPECSYLHVVEDSLCFLFFIPAFIFPADISYFFQVKCMQCSFCSNKFDPFIDLSLEIVKADSLCKALAHFTAIEQLDGGEKHYQCQHCKQKVRAHKQLTIHKAPYVLTIHLKRFGSYLVGQKIDKRIHFGPTLDLKPFVTDPYVSSYTNFSVLCYYIYRIS